MDTVVLGQTGLKVTVAGLGCGGHSRLGIDTYGPSHASSLVRAAYDEGIRFFDTSPAYTTEGAVGDGLTGLSRDSYVLSTKFPYRSGSGGVKTGKELLETLDISLSKLKTDVIDIYHLHGVALQDYDQVMENLYPSLENARQWGKIRFLGITEIFAEDTTHDMLRLHALLGNWFQVIMVGYSLLNPSADKTIFPITREKNIGVLCMFAVRKALSNSEQLSRDIETILAHKQGDSDLLSKEHCLDFISDYGCSIPEAAYRFCRHNPDIHVTLTGTGNREHLHQNCQSLSQLPLPEELSKKLMQMFGNVDCVSGQS
jgi:aryl-alcohol dehydrogenase-like predicted oxidoreductase